jgi:CBS domain-containing protein
MEMQVHDAMTPEARIIDPNAHISDAARVMREENIGALPVGENDRLIGMVTDRDIAMRGVADGQTGNTAVRDVMSERIYYCFEDDDLNHAASIMAEHQIHRLPVLNRDKRLVGMLALADIARSNDTEAMKTALVGISEPTEQPRRD